MAAQRFTAAMLGAAVVLAGPALAQQKKQAPPSQQSQQQTADEIGVLNRQFVQLHGQGRYQEALEVARRIIPLAEKLLGRDDPQVGLAINNLAETLRSLGRYGEADPLYQRALAISEKALGPEHPDVGTALNNYALLKKAQGKYTDAEPLYLRAISIWERNPGPQSVEVARALSNLGELYREQGRWAAAEPLYKRSIAIREAALGPDHAIVATALNNLALLETARGRYEEAEPLYKRALTIWERALGPEHPYVATALGNLAELMRSSGRNAEADPLYRRALAIRIELLGAEHPQVAETLNNMALNADTLGRAEEVETLLRRALAMREKVLGQDHPEVAGSLNNLAEFYRDQGKPDAALPLYRRALGLWQRAHGPEHPDVATVLNNIGNLELDTGHAAEAERSFGAALAIRRKLLGKDHPQTGEIINNLAWSAFHQQGWGRAADLWRQSVEISVKRSRREGELGQATTTRARSDTERDGYRFAALVKAAHRAGGDAAQMDALAREMFTIAQWARGSEAAASLARMAARAATGSDSLAKLARERQDLVAEWHARDAALIEMRGEPPQQRKAAAEIALSQRLAAVDKRIGEIDAALARDFPDYAAIARPEPATVLDIQAVLGANEALVLMLDTPAWRPTREETFVWVVTKTDMRWIRSEIGSATLAREAAALRCGLDWSRWRDEGAKRCAALVGAAPSRTGLLPFDIGRAHALYKGLLGPADEMIRDKQLMVVASGALASLPLQVLVTEAAAASSAVSDPKGQTPSTAPAWLGVRNAITVLPATSSLKALRAHAKASQASEPFIGFGNPLLLGPDGKDRSAWARQTCEAVAALASPAMADARGVAQEAAKLMRGAQASVEELRRQPPLPETADELCAVARALAGDEATSVNLGEKASEARIKALSAAGSLAKGRVLHFATHGLVAGETALFTKGRAEPAIMLTPPQAASVDDDGLLTASEVGTLKLDADWVILSACNTAAGDGGPSDGKAGNALSGLARAFFYAGARALLVSHWYVDSQAAVALVTGAFEELRKEASIGRAEAMRRSTAALIASGGRAGHPMVWAPFVVVGEGGAGR